VPVETQFYPDKGHADTVAGFSIPARDRTPVLDQSVSFIESVTSVRTLREPQPQPAPAVSTPR